MGLNWAYIEQMGSKEAHLYSLKNIWALNGLNWECGLELGLLILILEKWA